MTQGMLFDFFGGVSQEGAGWAVDFEKVLYELARWLIPIAICLLAEGVWLEKQRKIEALACYRYGSVKLWWRRKFVKSLVHGAAMAAVLPAAAMAADLACGAGFAKEGWNILLLWSAHVITILSIFFVLDRTRLRGGAPAILLLLEGVTFLLGFSDGRRARFMFGMWGMYLQSQWRLGETGIPVLSSLVLETALAASGYLAGRILWKRRGIFE